MFANLTTTQLVALILGIVFSAIAVACSFFALRWAKKIKSRILACCITMIAPFIAITSWFVLIFSYVKAFKNDEVFNIFVSMALSLVVCFMILVVASLVFRKNKDRLAEIEQKEKEEEQKALEMRMAQVELAKEEARLKEEAKKERFEELKEELDSAEQDLYTEETVEAEEDLTSEETQEEEETETEVEENQEEVDEDIQEEAEETADENVEESVDDIYEAFTPADDDDDE